MHERKVPQDRSLRAFRLAREFCKEPGISIDGIMEKIQDVEPDIDRETAWVAADQAVNERRERSEDGTKSFGYLVVALIMAGVSIVFAGEWRFIPLLIVAVLILWLVARINDN